jgi:hypothetical protein
MVGNDLDFDMTCAVYELLEEDGWVAEHFERIGPSALEGVLHLVC